jgi:hypothetical protein
MKIITIVCTSLLSLLALATPASAQTILWGSAVGMVGDTDVVTPGTYVDAATFFGSPLTVNGVVFNSIVSGSDGFNIAITTPNGVGPFTAPFSSTTPSSANYSNLTSVLGFGYFNTGTVTLSGLVTGHSYEVQAWSYYSGEASGPNTVLTGTNSVGLDTLTGQYAIGTFTATSGVETFNYDWTAGDGHNVINAVSLRDVTVTSAPEPSQTVMLALGLVALAFYVRSKGVRSSLG